MAQTAAHLIDNVMPRVPVRQVVLSVPKRIRWFLHRDPKVLGGVLRVFLRALRTTMRKHSPQAPPDAQIGAVSFSHRAGSSLNVHPHFHGAVCDGVFAENSEGEAVFYPATELSKEVFAALQETLRKRILGFLVRHGILDSLDADDMLQWDHGGGFSLHGAVRIDEWDRLGQEKLLRYCARPAFALERLARWDDERLVYQFQRPLPDGQTCQVFSPMELMKRLAELIPPPWMNLVRYYGVLAPHAKLREKVVMLAGPSEALRIRLQEAAENMGIEQNRKETPEPNSQENESTTRKRASVCWAILMARIFELLPLQCPRCGHPMKIVGFIMEPSNVNKVLEHLELPTETPVAHPPRPPPQTEMEFADDS